MHSEFSKSCSVFIKNVLLCNSDTRMEKKFLYISLHLLSTYQCVYTVSNKTDSNPCPSSGTGGGGYVPVGLLSNEPSTLRKKSLHVPA
jgi:hypothetical protein